MTKNADAAIPRQISTVTGRYVLGGQPDRPGHNILACRLKSISETAFVVSAPVIEPVGAVVTATFVPFGTLRGRISRHVSDGFAVDIEASAASRAELGRRIDIFQHRVWHGDAEKRSEQRFLPGEPRSIIVLPGGRVLPCLVIDYSVSGAAVSAEFEPPVGSAVVIGEVAGRVVRCFDVGFAVQFDAMQDRDDVERLLEAPEEWRQAVSVAGPRIETSEGEDIALAGAAY